jgi:SHO1 osmosensor
MASLGGAGAGISSAHSNGTAAPAMAGQGQPLMMGQETQSPPQDYAYRARALYACEFFRGEKKITLTQLLTFRSIVLDSASPDDPNELGFSKGEILDIVDNSGKWWQARKSDGSTGIGTRKTFFFLLSN